MKIGFGQRIALIEIDRALARHRVVGRFDIGVRVARDRRGGSSKSGMRCSPDSSTTNESSPLRSAAQLWTPDRERRQRRSSPSLFKSAMPSCLRRQAAKASTTIKAMITAAGTHQFAATQSIQDPDSAGCGDRLLLDRPARAPARVGNVLWRRRRRPQCRRARTSGALPARGSAARRCGRAARRRSAGAGAGVCGGAGAGRRCCAVRCRACAAARSVRCCGYRSGDAIPRAVPPDP